MRKELETIKIKRDRTFKYSLLTNVNRKNRYCIYSNRNSYKDLLYVSITIFSKSIELPNESYTLSITL